MTKHITVVDGTILSLRTAQKDPAIVRSIIFLCPCGKKSRRNVSEIVGQNEDIVQFKCKGCEAIVNLPKKREDIEKMLEPKAHGQVQT